MLRKKAITKRGNLRWDMLHHIVKLMHKYGEDNAYHGDYLAEKMLAEDYWEGRPDSPERTISSYFSVNKHIFERVQMGYYRLRTPYLKANIEWK